MSEQQLSLGASPWGTEASMVGLGKTPMCPPSCQKPGPLCWTPKVRCDRTVVGTWGETDSSQADSQKDKQLPGRNLHTLARNWGPGTEVRLKAQESVQGVELGSGGLPMLAAGVGGHQGGVRVLGRLPVWPTRRSVLGALGAGC